MKTLTRLEICNCEICQGSPRSADDGSLVDYEEAAAALAERDARIAELEGLCAISEEETKDGK